MIRSILIALAAITSVHGFSTFLGTRLTMKSKGARTSAVRSVITMENFDLSDNYEVETDPLIFGEANLWNFRESYNGPEVRMNPIEAIIDMWFKGDGSEAAAAAAAGGGIAFGSAVNKNLKKTVSLSVLQSKTEDYIDGSIDARSYAQTLKGAFGFNLKKAVPEILDSLPADKASELQSVL